MTKLPPGFSHELREHLTNHPVMDDVTGVPFIDLENYCCGSDPTLHLSNTQTDDA
jgi:7,8-dihydropterin-6-yl-methyl-4-(beta-D-ribofuranosyl)aminobenzene 5'-phosphate synthase